MRKHWRIRPHDAAGTAALARAANVSPVVAQLLLGRGFSDPVSIRAFLDAKLSTLRDPETLPGAAAAAERLHAAIRDKRRIVVYGDYDVDGMTGTSLLYLGLRLLGGDVGYYVPHRLEEGYGLNSDALRKLAKQGASLIVTVDCGITAIEEAKVARELGLELIITDHHQPLPELPDAAEIVHPGLPDRPYPFAGLSGSGVALKLAWAICKQASGAKRVGEAMKDYLLQAVAFASLGTVADVVPLVDENRVLVKHGLKSLKDRPTVGLLELMKAAEIHEKAALDCEDIGFAIAPRLNAAGRFGQASLAVELLTTDNATRAAEVAQYLDELNQSRQTVERSIYLSALRQAEEKFDPENDPALVLADRGWNQGVVGIVAGRLAEKFNRPVVLIAQDAFGLKPGTGSARSASGVDLHAALNACKHHLVGCGGHAAAAGLTIEDAKLDAFRAEFLERVAEAAAGAPREATLWIDAEAPLPSFTLRTLQELDQLSPFGCGHTRPLWCAS
ncbi:MAG TPA: single-stranded-DNA-specific exonuclease RecJ, partial [Pirellulales bacterium]